MINDVFLYEGDSIKGFTVQNITENFVILESQTKEIVLKLQ